MHKLLNRIVKRYLQDESLVEHNPKLFFAISEAFVAHEQDQYMLDRTLKLTSSELNEINSSLHSKLEENESAKAQVEEALARQQAVLDTIPEAVCSVRPDGALSLVNKSALALIELDQDELFALSPKEMLNHWLKKLVDPNSFINDLKKVNDQFRLQLNGYLELKNGKFYEFFSLAEELESKYLGRVWCFRDVTVTKQSEDKLRHQAFHDPLTGLPNRLLLIESITHALEVAKRYEMQLAVMFIDLDDFKKINDTAGHDVGDQYLIEVSAKINASLRTGDILGRLGGDEFLVFLEGSKDQREFIYVKERILKLLNEPIIINTVAYTVTCSIGLSIYPNDGAEADELIRKADMAMYHAKKNGKNTFSYFNPKLEKIALHRFSIDSQLRESIKNKDFFLVYQPKVDLQTQSIIGVEALIRWRNSDGQVVFPDKFIQIAEEIGLIHQITQWVIQSACEKLVEWRGTALENCNIAVNISALDFNEDSFTNFVESTIRRYAVDANCLEFELTESVFLGESKYTKSAMHFFKKIGIVLSIDDFGSGFSSFSYLNEFNIDCLKIDRSFISNISLGSRSFAIVKSITDVAKNLGIKVVAEGVETKEELAVIESVHCDFCQGYFFSKALNEQDLFNFVKCYNT